MGLGFSIEALGFKVLGFGSQGLRGAGQFRVPKP